MFEQCLQICSYLICSYMLLSDTIPSSQNVLLEIQTSIYQEVNKKVLHCHTHGCLSIHW